MLTPVKATGTPATPTDIVGMASSSLINSRLKMVISRLTIVLLLKIELNNNKWEFIMANHKLHIWSHQVLTTVKCFQTVKYQFLKYLDSHKYRTKQA